MTPPVGASTSRTLAAPSAPGRNAHRVAEAPVGCRDELTGAALQELVRGCTTNREPNPIPTGCADHLVRPHPFLIPPLPHAAPSRLPITGHTSSPMTTSSRTPRRPHRGPPMAPAQSPPRSGDDRASTSARDTFLAASSGRIDTFFAAPHSAPPSLAECSLMRLVSGRTCLHSQQGPADPKPVPAPSPLGWSQRTEGVTRDPLLHRSARSRT